MGFHRTSHLIKSLQLRALGQQAWIGATRRAVVLGLIFLVGVGWRFLPQAATTKSATTFKNFSLRLAHHSKLELAAMPKKLTH